MPNLARILQTILPQPLLDWARQIHLLRSLPPHIRAKVKSLKKGDICIDCGANVGKVSGLFAAYGATVYAFEPNPYAFAELKKRASKTPAIKPLASAVGTEAGQKVKLYFHEDHAENPLGFSQGSSLMPGKPNVGDKGIEVESVDLAQFIGTLSAVKILKIDVEGFETILVPALIARRALDKVAAVYVETHDHKWSALAAATEDMKDKVSASTYRGKVFWDWP